MDAQELEHAAAELVRLQAAASQITERIDVLKDLLRKAGPGDHRAGNFTVAVVPFRRLDEAKVRERFDPATYPLLYKRVVDGPKLKAHVPERVYRELMSESGKARVQVR